MSKLTEAQKQEIIDNFEVILQSTIAGEIYRYSLEEAIRRGYLVQSDKRDANRTIKKCRTRNASLLNELDKKGIDAFNYLFEGLDEYVNKVTSLQPSIRYKMNGFIEDRVINLNKYFNVGFSMLLETSNIEYRKEINNLKNALNKILEKMEND